MFRSLTVAGILAGSLLVPVPPATAVTVDVDVDNFAYSPDQVTVSLGGTVAWTFSDVTAHDTASDDGFWDSPLLDGGAVWTWTFESAGTFDYHCTPHPHMTGTVAVKLRAKGSAEEGWTLRWATDAATGYEYDVQVRRKGTEDWKSLATDTTEPSGTFAPKRSGTWFVRARTSIVDGEGTSRWSPRTAVTA